MTDSLAAIVARLRNETLVWIQGEDRDLAADILAVLDTLEQAQTRLVNLGWRGSHDMRCPQWAIPCRCDYWQALAAVQEESNSEAEAQ